LPEADNDFPAMENANHLYLELKRYHSRGEVLLFYDRLPVKAAGFFYYK